MKKIVSLLLAMAMMFTLVTTIAFADENNSVSLVETEKTDTSLTLKLVVQTNLQVRQIGITLDLTDAFNKGATVSSFKGFGSYVFNVNSSRKVLSSSYVDMTGVTGVTGTIELGTVTFDMSNVTESFTLSQGRALDIKDMSGTSVVSQFTNTAYGLVVEPLAPTTKTYTVKFVDWDGTELKTETVEEGKAATAPADPVRDGYEFTGWDVDFSNVTSDLTVTAQYTEIVIEEPATKIPFGTDGKAIFLDSEAKVFTFSTDDYINITSAADSLTKKFGRQYFINKGIEGEGSITATFGVVAADTYEDGNFTFDIVNK